MTITREEFEAYVGAGKYLEKWQSIIEKKSRFAGFNIWAAIFGHGFFFYRKMYVWGMLLVALGLILHVIFGALYGAMFAVLANNGWATLQDMQSHIWLVNGIALLFQMVIAGMFANVIYYESACSAINALSEKKNDEFYLNYIKKRGGVSMLGILAGSMVNIFCYYFT
ncbi:DUF2628 domain-containing protein [Paludibacterium purpuratum]|uniref:Uncharacterized protein DUF2628 n=1 Tax=Paludibacterium purpuratum TaxID=1144873 RepID=A0A4R7AWA7_9NEIS|nr:DUF2628 domain-containing protein [Paludibacterium purpuratum]TDR70235.1 uncharacterized protein DUF2628 [Paludibacterium purpuratum]